MLPFTRMLVYANNSIILNGNYTQIATTPTGYFNFGTVPYSTRIYVMGGVTSGATLTNTGYYFEPSNPTVRTSIANLPRILFNFGITQHSNNIYVYGGTTRNTPTGANIENLALYVYNITTNSWSTPTPINKPSTGGYCKMVTVGDYIYLFGLSSSYTQLYRYDPSTSTFTTLASSTTQLSASLGGLCTDGVRYIYTSTNNVIERYDIDTNTWTILQTGTGIYGECVYLNNYVYIHDRLQFGRYNITANTLDIVPTSINTYRGGLVVNSSQVFNIMGYTGSAPVNTIYRIT